MGIIQKTIRDLRKQSTPAERVLWEELRNRKFCNKKFVRQFPITFEYEKKNRFFVADFYCHKIKLVIELDGEIHEKQKDYDELRSYIINQLGVQVIRFKNKEILENLKNSLDRLEKIITENE